MKKKEELASLAATFVATVKHLQQEAGVNDSELSRAIDLDRGTLSRLLSGETIDPRLSTISAIARFFAVPMSSLFGEESRGFVPVYEQRSLRDARKVSSAPRHGQLWIRVSNANSSRFAIALAPKSRTEPLPHNAILGEGVWIFGTLLTFVIAYGAVQKFLTAPQKAETTLPLQLLKTLLDYKRQELNDLKDGILNNSGTARTTTAFLDMVQLRHPQIDTPVNFWVR